MRILIYGAGVIGSLYAVLFAETGYDTSIYARGKRLELFKNPDIRRHNMQHEELFCCHSAEWVEEVRKAVEGDR